MNAEVISLKDGTRTSGAIECSNCARALEPDWIVWTGKRHLCGQCLESGGYDAGFREAARRAGIDVGDLVAGTTPGTSLYVVLAELDRIEQLPTVQDDDGRANTFAVGARWTVRMIRDAIERGAPAEPIGLDRPPLAVVPPTVA